MRDRIIASLGMEDHSFLVPDYWFMLTLAIVLGAILTVRMARRHGLSEHDALQAVFYSILLLLPGARLVYAVQYWDQFSAAPWRLVDPAQGGLALLGGLLGFLAGALYLHRRHASVAAYLDASVPALASGLFLGRIGCFLAGCNWGKTTDLPWAVCFPPPHHAWRQHLKAGLISADAPLSLPIHPTQLYESLFGLIAFGIIMWWFNHHRVSKRSGSAFLVAISAYAIFRFLVEYVRADASGLGFGPLTMAQALSLVILLASTGILTAIHHGRTPGSRTAGSGELGQNRIQAS